MNYGDVLRRENSDGSKRNISRKDMIDMIYKLFDVDSKEVAEAAKDAGLSYPDQPIQYYFIASCVSAKKQLIRDIEEEDYGELYDTDELVDQRAEDQVPYQTYVIWLLWVEFGYEVNPDEMPFFGDDYDIESDLDKIPQAYLYYRARDIVSKALSETGY